MDKDFWLQRWKENDIGFHHPEANPTLVKYFPKLSLAPNSRVFIPLCGKTLDIPWLLAKGYRVAGAELSQMAIEQLFAGLGVKPIITTLGKIDHYRATGIDIFVGNIFDLTKNQLGPIDAIYDRAALVALPADMRTRYTKHLIETTSNAPQLLVSFEYDQKLMEGPPFSVSQEEVTRHYQKHYDLALLASSDIPGGLKGKCPANENAWLLKKLGTRT